MPVFLCVNLLDEAEQRGIILDLPALSEQLQIPVAGVTARSGIGMQALQQQLLAFLRKPYCSHCSISYPETIETAVQTLQAQLPQRDISPTNRWIALRLLEQDSALSAERLLPETPLSALEIPQVNGVADTIIAAIVQRAESIANTVTTVPEQARKREHRFDRFVLGKYTGIPLLLLLFLVLLWITIIGANYPSPCCKAVLPISEPF